MSATEKLRALLDEHGVEWMDEVKELGLTLASFVNTRWDSNGIVWRYIESKGTATLSVRPVEIRGCTPEQAIAVTLGVGQLKKENAELRKELDSWHRLTAGIELPDYPVTQFQPKDLERENAKLRKLVADMYEAMWCVSETWAEDVCADRMRELGIVVDRMHEPGIEVMGA